MMKGGLTLISKSMVSFADLPFKFPLLPPSRFLDPLVLAFGIMKLLHPVRPKQRVEQRNTELCWCFLPETEFETSLQVDLKMRTLLSKQEEPSLYPSKVITFHTF